MLFCRNIRFRYRDKRNFLFKNISIEIEKGKITFLEGANGSGKTTLGLILAGTIPSLIPGDFFGDVIIEGRIKRKNELLSNEVGFLFQNPDNFFTAVTPREEINISVTKSPFGISNINNFINYLGIEKLLDIPLAKLSRGQKQVVAIAALLIQNPDYLILDDPFSELDYDFQNKIINFLNELPKRFNKGLMVISNELIKKLNVGKFYKLVDGEIFDSSSYKYREDIHQKILNYQRKKKIAYVNLILDAKGVTYKYKGSRENAIDNIDAQIKEGECLGIMGPNGSGKSTFLLTISCLLKRKKGKIYYIDENGNSKNIKNYNIKRIAITFQNPDYQIFEKSIREEIEYVPKILGYKKEEIEYLLEKFKNSWLRVNLSDDPFSLSFGQKKLLSMFNVLIARPKVIMLDEPFSGLDGKNIEIIINKIYDLRKSKSAVIIASHDQNLLSIVCDRIIYFKDGHISKKDVKTSNY